MTSTAVALLTVAVLTAAPEVHVVTTLGRPRLVRARSSPLQTERLSELVGEVVSGRLVGLTPTAVEVEQDGQRRKVSLHDVLRIEWTARSDADLLLTEPSGILLGLTDGGRLHVRSLQVKSAQTVVESKRLGKLTLPAQAVHTVKLKTGSAELENEWQALVQRNFDRDVLVVQKQTDGKAVLDYLAGAVGDIENGRVQFLLDNEPLPVPLQKLFGIIYYRRQSSSGSTACQVRLADGSRLLARAVSTHDDKLTLQSAWGEVAVPLSEVAWLDFTPASVRYLADLSPREVDYKSYFDVVWKFRANKNLDGDPLRLPGHTFAHGLCVHSRTRLQYSPNGAYRRFWAVVGIDQSVRPLGHVRLVVEGDGRPLFQADVAGSDEPRLLDLDVSGVRTLEILVDFGRYMDIADHLDLADAKLLK